MSSRRSWLGTIVGVVAVALAGPPWLPAYSDEPLSSQQILDSLWAPKKRGIQDPQSINDLSAIERLKSARKTRGLTAGERDELYQIGERRAQVDLTIYFAFNSADITPEAIAGLQQLGKALSDPSMKGSTIAIAGHTDAKGEQTYNQSLSERRAEAVKRYLTQNFSLDPSALLATGYGASKLKNPADPFSNENRRVQIINLIQ